jgi:hypothetical protein
MKPSPRVVRNFYVRAEVDGRRSLVSGGPRARDGGLALTLYQRRNGEAATAIEIYCFALPDGRLVVEVKPILPHSFERKSGTLRIETKR